MKGPYFDTVKESSQKKIDYSNIAELQNVAVLEIFKNNIGKNFTADDIHHILGGDEKILLTSVRRAITTLTVKVGVLRKTDEKRPGGRGRDTNTWTYINSPKITPMSDNTQKLNEQDVPEVKEVEVVPAVEATSENLPETKPVHPIIHQMFSGYNLGVEQQKVMGLMVQIFDRSIILMDRFNKEKDNYKVDNIEDAKLKAEAAKGLQKTISKERLELSRLVKAERDRIKQSIVIETTTDKILANGLKILESFYKDMENTLSVTANFEANYKLEQQKKLRSERMAELEKLQIINYVPSNELAKIDQYSEEAYRETIIETALSNKKQADIIEEQRQIDEEKKNILKNRIDILNGITSKDHPIKNKLTIETSQHDFLKLIEELSIFVTEERKRNEALVAASSATGPDPIQSGPATPAQPVSDPIKFTPPPPVPPVIAPPFQPVVPAQAAVAETQPDSAPVVQTENKGRVGENGEYVVHPHVNPSDPFWNVSAQQPVKSAPAQNTPVVAPVVNTPAQQPAQNIPVMDADDPFATTYIPEGAIISGSQATVQNVKSPETLDQEELLFYINNFHINLPQMRTKSGIDKANLIWQKFNGFKAWAASIVSNQK